MSEATLYAAPIGGSRLTITARPTAIGSNQAQWIVRFCRQSARTRMLDQCAAWLPGLDCWDQSRWHPVGSRLVPPAALATVEAWLRGPAVGEVG